MAYKITDRGRLENVDPNADEITCPRTDVLIIATDDGGDLTPEDREQLADNVRMRCHCIHDCCGHRNGGLSFVKKLYDGVYIATITSSLNY